MLLASLIPAQQLHAFGKEAALTGNAQAVNEAVDELTTLMMPVSGRVTLNFKGSDTAVLGDEKSIDVHSEIEGRLILIDIDSDGNVVQLYPNQYTELKRWKVRAGETITIPDSSVYKFRASEPVGKNVMLAIVVPSAFDDSALVTNPKRVGNDFSVEADPYQYLKTLIGLIKSLYGTANKGLVIESTIQSRGVWAFGSKEYIVTKNRDNQNDYYVDEEHPTSQIFLEPIDQSLDSSRAIVRELYEKGMSVTKLSEGFRSNMYLDAAHFCTIAYGHLIKKEPCDGRPEEFARGLSEKRGEELLNVDMKRAKAAVLTFAKVELTDGQYAALSDFTFNVGTGNLKKSTLLKLVNRKQFNMVPLEFRKWVKAGGRIFRGLQTRREREISLFFDGELVPSTKSIVPGEMIDIRLGETGE